MSEDRIRLDLGKKILEKISPQIEAEFNLALAVLPNDQVALLAIDLATVLAASCLLVPVQFAANENRADLFEATIGWLGQRLRDRRELLFAALGRGSESGVAR